MCVCVAREVLTPFFFPSPSHVNQELQEAINTMYTNASIYLSKMRGAPNPVGPKPSNFPQGIVGQVVLLFCSWLEAEWLSSLHLLPHLVFCTRWYLASVLALAVLVCSIKWFFERNLKWSRGSEKTLRIFLTECFANENTQPAQLWRSCHLFQTTNGQADSSFSYLPID